jgi:hypothetical protein
MNPDEPPAPPQESEATTERGEYAAAPGGPTDDHGQPAPPHQRSGWGTFVRISPAILFTIAYAVLEHRYYAQGGRDGLNSLANGLFLLPLGLVAALVVAVLSAGSAVLHRPPHRSAALVWVGTVILIVLLNVCLMFGGCLVVAKMQST